MRKRIVITGIGVVSPIGTGKEKFWEALISGKSGINKCKKINTLKYKNNVAAEVNDFIASRYIKPKRLKNITLTTQYAMAAVKMALDDSGITIAPFNNAGVVLGANTADPLAHETSAAYWSRHGYSATPLRIYKNLNTNFQAVTIAEYFGLKGPCVVIPAACAAGNTTIAYAFDVIMSGQIPVMLAGGYDPLNHISYGGFDSLRAVSSQYCQPFDKNRKGMIVGEGAGVILLEDMEHALKRKAKIYAEILGYGLACDAYNVAIPDPEGKAGILAVKMALKMSKVMPADIDYINAHGTGTVSNDRMESRVIRSVFKSCTDKIPVSSIKSMVGHCMGAASGIEACACALIAQRDIIPPNINYYEPDPYCNLNIVANKALKKRVNVMLSNSFAFGGNAAAIVIAKFKKNGKYAR